MRERAAGRRCLPPPRTRRTQGVLRVSAPGVAHGVADGVLLRDVGVVRRPLHLRLGPAGGGGRAGRRRDRAPVAAGSAGGRSRVSSEAQRVARGRETQKRSAATERGVFSCGAPAVAREARFASVKRARAPRALCSRRGLQLLRRQLWRVPRGAGANELERLVGRLDICTAPIDPGGAGLQGPGLGEDAVLVPQVNEEERSQPGRQERSEEEHAAPARHYGRVFMLPAAQRPHLAWLAHARGSLTLGILHGQTFWAVLAATQFSDRA